MGELCQPPRKMWQALVKGFGVPSILPDEYLLQEKMPRLSGRSPCPLRVFILFSPSQNTLHAVTCHEKVVAVWKDHTESLGMTVAGGATNREWDLPIYVISVEPGGVISRDSRIKTGKKALSLKVCFNSKASFEKQGG